MNCLDFKFRTEGLDAVCRCCLKELKAQRIAIDDRIEHLIEILTNDVSSPEKFKLLTFKKVFVFIFRQLIHRC